MNIKFFFHKMKEVGNFLKILRGKATNDSQKRIEGVDGALNAMKDEKQDYEEEKSKAEDKVLRESGGQDITAI